MIRTVSIITLAALVLSAICLSLAISLAGPDLISEGVWGWGPWTGRHHFGLSYTRSFDGPQATREIPWKGGDHLMVYIPADVTFTQAEGPPRMVIHGPKDALDSLLLDSNAIMPKVVHGNDAASRAYQGAGISIELTAPKVTSFQLYNIGKLDIRNYHQDRLEIGVFGDGRDVTAEGATKRVDITLNGSGEADLSRLATDEAAVTVSGSGQVKVGPKTWAKLDVSGSGEVSLLSHPAQVQTNITGSGHVDQDEATDEDQSGEAPAKPAKSAKPGRRT